MNKILQRFVDVWKPNFLHDLTTSKEKTLKTTILFWVLSGMIVSILMVVYSLYSFSGDVISLVDSINDNSIVSDDATMTFKDKELSIQNIENPFVLSSEKENEEFLVIIDTVNDGLYDVATLDGYSSGVIVLKDRIHFKNGDVRSLVFNESEIEDFSWSVADVKYQINKYSGVFILVIGLVVFMVFMFMLVIVRLLTALWWALMLFLFSLAFEIKISYGRCYEAVLNFYFIVLVIEVTLMIILPISIPFITFCIFLILFLVNLLWMKNNKNSELSNNKLENKAEKVFE